MREKTKNMQKNLHGSIKVCTFAIPFEKAPLFQRSEIYRGVEQLVARRAHNPEVVGSSPASATKKAIRKGCLFVLTKFGKQSPR